MKRLVAEQTATGNDEVATTYAYNALLHGWARSGEGGYAAQRAEQVRETIHLNSHVMYFNFFTRPMAYHYQNVEEASLFSAT